MTNIYTVKQRISYPLILLKQLVKTDFKLRYQGSALGYIWSLLKPLFLFGILYVVFVGVLKVDYGVEHSGVYLLLGIVLWSFFAELTGGSVMSVVGKGDLIRKLNFPKYVIVLATAFSALINFLLNTIIVIFFMILAGVDISLYVLLAPLFFIELFMFSLSIGFFLSAVFVKLRDIGHIWEILMQALFYLTPILFPLSFAPPWAQKILMLNPLAQIIQDMRFLLVSNETVTITDVYGGNQFIRFVPAAVVVIGLGLSIFYFNRKSGNFAEDI